MNFLIATPDYSTSSGGIMALHKLCNNINLLGVKSFLACSQKNNEWLGECISTVGGLENINMNEDVVVYPEIVYGNPLNFKNVVRWILNTPGVMGNEGDTSHTWLDTDLIFKFAEHFKVPERFTISGELRAFDAQLNFWQNYNRDRTGTCYLVRKWMGKELNKHAEESVRVDGYSNVVLREFFNSKERFICYDSECFTAVQAALCGIEVIVIPDLTGTTPEQWRAGFPYFQNGIAYGFNDVEHAKETLTYVRPHMKYLEDETMVLTNNFIKICEEKFAA